MKSDNVLVTFINKDGEEKKVIMSRGERVRLRSGKFICVGVTPKEELDNTIRVEEITKENSKKKKLSLFQKK